MIESGLSQHWTDDQLIAHLYGVGPEDGHLDECRECQLRVSAMELRRTHVGEDADDVSPVYLAEQRRRIYGALSARKSWWSLAIRRWAPAGAAATALAASLFYYTEQQRSHEHRSTISDAQLAQEVSELSEGPEVSPVAPLKGLFIE